MSAAHPHWRPLRLGTRGSRLALAQSGMVAHELRATGVAVELVVVRTEGDDRPPDTAWGEGAFVGALETALLDGSVDLAVHSAKDVPTTEDPRLTIAAFARREDPRDALVTREPGAGLDALPAGCRVGTDSPRRSAFIRRRRPDLEVHSLHGNVDTRLRRLDDGATDALILAVAGLRRLGLEDRIVEVLPERVVPPAPGQGALAIQTRADDAEAVRLVAVLDDQATRMEVEAERAFLRATGGGCRAPVGALARVEGDSISIIGGSAGPSSSCEREGDGADTIPSVAWGEIRGPVAERRSLAAALAVRLGDQLEATGAAARSDVDAHPAGSPSRVLVTRAAEQAGPLVSALRERDVDVVQIPTIALEPAAPGGSLDAAAADLAAYDWIVVTSANGADAVADALDRLGVDPMHARWVAVGSSTAAALTGRGIPVAFTPARSSGEGIAAELDLQPGQRILLARSDIADSHLPERLRDRGAQVDEVAAYRTVEAPEASREPLQAAFAEGPFAALVFTSGSTVRGLLRLLTPSQRRVALRTTACCIGPSTAAVAREAGFARIVEAPMRSAAALAEIVVTAAQEEVVP